VLEIQGLYFNIHPNVRPVQALQSGGSVNNMRGDARLNLLLTPPPAAYERGGGQPWHRTVPQLLMPMGVRTFEGTNGPQAMELMERYPIHLAVVDTRLPAIGGLNVLQLIQRLREHGQHPVLPIANAAKTALKDVIDSEKNAKNYSELVPGSNSGEFPTNNPESPAIPAATAFQFHMKVEERSQSGQTQTRIEVRFEAHVQPLIGPVVILIAPPPAQQDKTLLREALKFNAFSVLSEPVDVDVALEVMARAMKRWFAGVWPVG